MAVLGRDRSGETQPRVVLVDRRTPRDVVGDRFFDPSLLGRRSIAHGFPTAHRTTADSNDRFMAKK